MEGARHSGRMMAHPLRAHQKDNTRGKKILMMVVVWVGFLVLLPTQDWNMSRLEADVFMALRRNP